MKQATILIALLFAILAAARMHKEARIRDLPFMIKALSISVMLLCIVQLGGCASAPPVDEQIEGWRWLLSHDCPRAVWNYNSWQLKECQS